MTYMRLLVVIVLVTYCIVLANSAPRKTNPSKKCAKYQECNKCANDNSCVWKDKCIHWKEGSRYPRNSVAANPSECRRKPTQPRKCNLCTAGTPENECKGRTPYCCGCRTSGTCQAGPCLLKCAVGPCDEPAPAEGCDYNGEHYDVGASFQADDGCNTCQCIDDGSVSCTKINCNGCTYNGHHYDAGDSFDATDGCNTCQCLDNGSVSCTKIGCSNGCKYNGESYENGDQFDSTDGCNTCTCSENGEVACTERACAPKTGCDTMNCPEGTTCDDSLYPQCLCPDGTRQVNCFAEPCAVSQCHVIGATCTDNYCGGCYAIWKISGRILSKQECRRG